MGREGEIDPIDDSDFVLFVLCVGANKVESFVVDLLERHCGPKAAQSANTRRHFTDAILAGSATPDTVRSQILQLAQVPRYFIYIFKKNIIDVYQLYFYLYYYLLFII
jgi:hypothetical protein